MIRQAGLGVKPPSYDVSAAEYFSYLTGTVPASVKSLVNNLVKTLKANDDWRWVSHLPLMNMPNEQNALVNLRTPSDPLMINYNGCVHYPYIGMGGNGVNSYIDSNFNPGTFSGAFTQDSCFISSYDVDDLNGSRVSIGSYAPGPDTFLQIRPRQSGDSLIYMSTGGGSAQGAVASSVGLTMGYRSNNSENKLYKSGVLINTGFNGSLALKNLNLFILARNSNGTADNFCSNKIALTCCGGSPVNPSTLDAALTTFINAMALL